MVFRVGACLVSALAVIAGCSSSSTGASSGGGTANPNKKCFQTESTLTCRCDASGKTPTSQGDPYSPVDTCAKPAGYRWQCFAEPDEDGEECKCEALACKSGTISGCSCRRASLLFGGTSADVDALTDACPEPDSETICCKRLSEPDCDCSSLECSEGYEKVDNCTAAILVDKHNADTLVPSGECKLPSEL